MPEWKDEIRKRLAGLQLEATREAEIVEELAQHLDDRDAELLAGGMTVEEAWRAALAEIGESELLGQELGRVERPTRREPVVCGAGRMNMIADLWQDLRYAVRMLRKQPGFTVVAVLTLALGIGINTAIFTMFNLWFRPLPVKDPETVVKLQWLGGTRGEGSPNFSLPEYSYLRDHTDGFSGLIASTWNWSFILGTQSAGEETQKVFGQFVSDNFFSTLGVNTVLGRPFAPDESRTSSKDLVVVLSYDFWQRRFGGDPNILGQAIWLNGHSVAVIGVAERGFGGLTFEPRMDFWLPLTMAAQVFPQSDWSATRFKGVRIFGRLNPGRTPEHARAEMTELAGQLVRAHPELDPKTKVLVVQQSMFGDVDWEGMSVVLTATAVVLLIACANLANLLLARAVARRKEIGVRLCLGASRSRLVRQLLTESLLLAGVGGVAGLLLAWWSVKFIAPAIFAARGVTNLQAMAAHLNPDARVLSYALLLSLLTGLAFGLIPARRAARADLVSTVKDDGASFGERLSRSRLRNGLVVTQMALSLVLLISAGVLLRGLMRAGEINPGFETKKVLRLDFDLSSSGYDQSRGRQFHQELAARLEALPGVERVCQVLRAPFRGGDRTTLTVPEGTESAAGRSISGFYNAVTPNYFDALGIPIVRGRGFTTEDMTAPVAVITEAVARRLWPDQQPLGKLLRVESNAPFAEVIGVARDSQSVRLGQSDPLLVYVPLATRHGWDPTVLVRTSVDARQIQSQIQTAVRVGPRALWSVTSSLEDDITGSELVGITRMSSVLAGSLGLLALLLASVGLHGVMAYSVTQRTREIGIRMALGASRQAVLRLVMGQGLRLVGIGAALGVAGGAAASQVMKSLLFGLSPFDPIAYAGVSVFLVAVASLAMYLPARRASLIEPMVALRYE